VTAAAKAAGLVAMDWEADSKAQGWAVEDWAAQEVAAQAAPG